MTRENNIKNFLREYKELCKKYNVSLGHEDEYGGFKVNIMASMENLNIHLERFRCFYRLRYF